MEEERKKREAEVTLALALALSLTLTLTLTLTTDPNPNPNPNQVASRPRRASAPPSPRCRASLPSRPASRSRTTREAPGGCRRGGWLHPSPILSTAQRALPRAWAVATIADPLIRLCHYLRHPSTVIKRIKPYSVKIGEAQIPCCPRAELSALSVCLSVCLNKNYLHGTAVEPGWQRERSLRFADPAVSLRHPSRTKLTVTVTVCQRCTPCLVRWLSNKTTFHARTPPSTKPGSAVAAP